MVSGAQQLHDLHRQFIHFLSGLLLVSPHLLHVFPQFVSPLIDPGFTGLDFIPDQPQDGSEEA